MRAWVQKNDKGEYWDDLGEEWNKLCYATLYRTRKEMIETMSRFDLTKAVKVNIEEV